ncbi:MAG: LptF/LptG family permease [bacterium]|nr:LptF/LptG family permease [bacterium]
MSILDRYILRFFLGFFFLALSICLCIVLVIPFVEELDTIIANRVPFKVMFLYLLYSVPTVFVQVIPMVVLLAILLALIGLNRHQELLAMQASGIGLPRLLVFVMVLICGIAAVTWYIDENICPYTFQQSKFIKTELMERKPPVPYLRKEQLWIRCEPHSLLSIGLIHRTGTRLLQVTWIKLSADETRITDRLDANDLLWNQAEQKWFVTTGSLRQFNESGDLIGETVVNNFPIEFPFQPTDLKQFAFHPSEFNTQQLKQYVEFIRASGLNANDYLVDFYLKYTNFISPIILALLGIAYGTILAPKTATKRFAIAILLAIGYYLSLLLMRHLGRAGVIYPFFSAMVVPLTFLLWSLYRIYRNSYS